MKNIIKSIGGFVSGLAIVVASISFGASPAYACSCMMPKPPAEALADSATVFQGKVTKITESSYRNGYKVSFAIEKSWKGESTKTADVSTARDSAACGIDFKVGKSYVAYTYADEDGSLTTGLCSRTHEFVAGDEDATALDFAISTTTTNTTANNASTTAGSGTYPYRPVVLTIGTVIVIGAAFYLARKQKVSSAQ